MAEMFSDSERFDFDEASRSKAANVMEDMFLKIEWEEIFQKYYPKVIHLAKEDRIGRILYLALGNEMDKKINPTNIPDKIAVEKKTIPAEEILCAETPDNDSETQFSPFKQKIYKGDDGETYIVGESEPIDDPQNSQML